MQFLELTELGAAVGNLLRERGQTLAVVDGATGGLISAALIAMPGATSFYIGGGIVYSLKGRDVLLDLTRSELSGMKSATEDYAVLQARAIRTRFGADWGLAESGSAGPGKHPFGVESGTSAIGVVGQEFEGAIRISTGTDDRVDNMHDFARAALQFMKDVLDAA
jgi:PncC family amidohydrolase